MVDVNTLLIQSFSDADFYEALGKAAQSKSQNKVDPPPACGLFGQIKTGGYTEGYYSTTTNYGKFPLAETTVIIDSVEVFSSKENGSTYVCPKSKWERSSDCDEEGYYEYWLEQTRKATFSFKYKYQDTKGTHTASYKLVVTLEKRAASFKENEVKEGIDLLCPTQAPCQNYTGLTEEAAILGIREYLGLDNTQLVSDIAKAKEEEARIKEEAYQKSRPTLFGQ